MIGPVLLVDDDPELVLLVERALQGAGIETIAANDGESARRLFEEHADELSAIVLDLVLPDTSGQELLATFVARRPEISTIVLSANDSLGDAIECMRLGAVDYVLKPFERTRLVTSVRNAGIQGRLRARVAGLARELQERSGQSAILGEAAPLERALRLVERAARSAVTVLLLGESGTGKELAARAVHLESSRRAEPFVVVNCGAIPEGLIESELFGHEAGAFTGAKQARAGFFEAADGGTIFLDEIGDLQPDLQVALLRVLQERSVVRVGGRRPRAVDVRVIAATHRDLKAEVDEGRFRGDLYYRLAVFPIELPSLRARGDDVLLLARHFLARFAARHGRALERITPEAERALLAYRWPGNVRELENVVERAVILEDGPALSLGSLPDVVVCATDADPEPPVLGVAADDGEVLPLAEVERRTIQRALVATGWNIKEAARRLEIGRATIYRKIERYGLQQQ